MEKYITSEIVQFCLGIAGVLYISLGLAVQFKKLLAKSSILEPITRGEYEKDEKHRGERMDAMGSRYTAHEERAEALIESMTRLRIEVASLTAQLQRPPQGECSCRTPSQPQPDLRPSSALLPRRSPASSPANSP